MLVVFGGKRSLSGAKLSDTALVEMSEYVYIIAIVTDTAQWYWFTVDTTAPLPNAVQGGDGQWVVGRVGAALEDKREYQQMLSEGWRRREEGGG